MSWFQLDASTIAGRVYSEGGDFRAPTLIGSIVRGIVGFTTASVAGLAPWAVFSEWSEIYLGEGGAFGVGAIVFLILSGLLLHRLIIGPGSLALFYKLFSVSFGVYAAVWFAGRLMWAGDAGNVAGLLAATIVMGWMLTRAFDAQGSLLKVLVVLVVCSGLGYFAGKCLEGRFGGLEGRLVALGGVEIAKAVEATVAKLLWGVTHAIGFGAGLGWVFYICQRDARELLAPAPATREPERG